MKDINLIDSCRAHLLMQYVGTSGSNSYIVGAGHFIRLNGIRLFYASFRVTYYSTPCIFLFKTTAHKAFNLVCSITK